MEKSKFYHAALEELLKEAKGLATQMAADMEREDAMDDASLEFVQLARRVARRADLLIWVERIEAETEATAAKKDPKKGG